MNKLARGGMMPKEIKPPLPVLGKKTNMKTPLPAGTKKRSRGK